MFPPHFVTTKLIFEKVQSKESFQTEKAYFKSMLQMGSVALPL
jgi:hypothetical protein